MKVLLFGGTGFIGKDLLKELLKNKHRVTVLSRNPDKIDKEFSDRVNTIKADVAQKRSLENWQ